MAGDNPPEAVLPVLQALAGDPRSHELGGFEKPLADYRAAHPTAPPTQTKAGGPIVLASLVGAKLGATVAGVAVGVGAVGLVAYTASQTPNAPDRAVTVASAPAATATGSSTEERPSATKTAVGPDATGPAAFSLCNAWKHHQANGAKTHGKSKDAPPFRNLAKAAGGEAKIAAYCAKVPHPGNDGKPDADDKDNPDGKANGKGAAKPTGKPSSLPTPTTTTSR